MTQHVREDAVDAQASDRVRGGHRRVRRGERGGPDQLAAVPRRGGGGGGRRSPAARHVGAGREPRLGDRHPRPVVELAHRVGRPHLRRHRGRRGRGGRTARPGRDLSGAVAGRIDERGGHDDVRRAARVDALRHRPGDGCDSLDEVPRDGGAGATLAPEDALRRGDAGHRRGTRVRLPRRHRALRARLRRRRALVGADGVAAASRLGLRDVAGRPRRPCVHRQRQRGAVVRGRVRRGDRRRAVAHGSATRGATGPPRSSGRTTSARSSSPRAGAA